MIHGYLGEPLIGPVVAPSCGGGLEDLLSVDPEAYQSSVWLGTGWLVGTQGEAGVLVPEPAVLFPRNPYRILKQQKQEALGQVSRMLPTRGCPEVLSTGRLWDFGTLG